VVGGGAAADALEGDAVELVVGAELGAGELDADVLQDAAVVVGLVAAVEAGVALTLGDAAELNITLGDPGTKYYFAPEVGEEDALDVDKRTLGEVFAPGDLADDLVAALHGAELARRQFREIARIAGLTFQGFPGRSKPARHLQASSNMFYDVFRDFDPENLLLSQAQREVLEGQLEFTRLDGAMRDVREQGFVIVRPDRLTPLAFPLWAETMRATYTSTESWETRVKKMAATLEETGEREGTRRA